MTTNNISVFSQPIVKGDVQTSKVEGKDDINLTDADMFSEFMDRSASMQAPDINTDKKETSAPARSASPEDSYNKMQSGTHSNIKRKDDSKEKVDTSSPENKKIVSEKAGKIKEAIKDELKVSDEDIEKVMDLLGLTDADLFDQNMLVKLVAELSGAQSAVDLLSMPGMSGLLDEVADIKTELATELSVSQDDLSDVVRLMEEPETDMKFEVPQDVQIQSVDHAAHDQTVSAAEFEGQNENVGVDSQVADNTAAADTVETVQRPDVAGNAASSSGSAVKTATDEEVSRNADVSSETDTEDGTEVRAEVKTESGNEGFSEPDEGFGGQTGSFAKKPVTEHFTETAGREAVHNAADTGVNLNPDVSLQASGAAEDVTSYIDVDNLIEQFATLTRNLENEQTTLSMRLNPENLGQLTLHVTEKQGNITAEVKVENEQVRDALNTQIAELKANIESAGVKVTAVEVTVESHEFESAYENQTGSAAGGEQRREDRQGEGAEEAMERITGIRNINLNNPDEIADNLTEAEIVNASMMRDNGNSVDFRA